MEKKEEKKITADSANVSTETKDVASIEAKIKAINDLQNQV